MLGGAKILHSPTPSGEQPDEWYVSFVRELPALKPLPPPERRVNGVNVTIGHRIGDERQIATVDDGRRYTVAQNAHTEHRLQVLQRLVEPQRKVHPNAKAADPHSKRTARRRAQIARLRRRQTRQTEYVQQYAAKRVVQTAEAIAYEQHDWRAERRNARQRKGHLKRGTRKIERQVHHAVAAASPGRFVELIKQKAEAGRAVVALEPHGSVEVCSVCGASIERAAIGRRKRWTGRSCDTVHDRTLKGACGTTACAIAT